MGQAGAEEAGLGPALEQFVYLPPSPGWVPLVTLHLGPPIPSQGQSLDGAQTLRTWDLAGLSASMWGSGDLGGCRHLEGEQDGGGR